MRRLLTLTIFVLLAAPGIALAADEGPAKTPLDHVEALAAYVAQDDANFEGGNALYKAAKAALAKEAEEIPDKDQRPAAKRYAEIQPAVAEALRHDHVPAMAWVMGIFGALLLWGGFAFCIGVARKKGGGKGSA
jgi:hypothetical protein